MGTDTQTDTQTTPTRGRIIVADGIYSVGDKNFVETKNLEIGVLTKLIVTARIRGNVVLKMFLVHFLKFLSG